MTIESGLGEIAAKLSVSGRLAAMLRPELSSLGEDIFQEIRTQIPEYDRPVDAAYEEAIRLGIEQAMTLFVDQIADPSTPTEPARQVHRWLGRNEMREGRHLDTLEAAYRIGSRVAWRRIMRVGKVNGLPSVVMSELADAVFALIDELSMAAREGFEQAKSDTSGVLRAWRRRLLELVTERPSPDKGAIAELAELIGWTVPERLVPVVVKLEAAVVVPDDVVLDPDVLIDLDADEPIALVPGELTPGRLEALRGAFRGARISVGPAVPLSKVADSLRWARNALELMERGVISRRRTVWVDQHLSTLLLHSDPGLIGQLRERLFAPLRGLTEKQRERLIETLVAWISARGGVLEMSELLGVHRQTVRYRMRQLEATFGEQLADPDERFAIELILRAAMPASHPARARDTVAKASRALVSGVPAR